MADTGDQQMKFGSATTVISLTASLSNGNIAGGTTELDNSSDLYPMAVATISIPDSFGGAPTDRSVIQLFAVRKDVDGTDDDTSAPTGTDSEAAEKVGDFLIYNTNEAQRNTITISLLGIKKADFFILNSTGQTATYTSNPITVKVTPFTYAASA